MRRFTSAIFGLAGLFLACGPSAEAVILDLTEDGTDSGTINSAIFQWVDSQSTGSGVIDPFVRISDSNSAEVEGINTSARPLTMQENTTLVFTHDLYITNVPINNLGGATNYYEFLLDVNQSGGDKSLISLDELQIFMNNTGYADDYTQPAPGDYSFLGLLVYDLDTGANSHIILDASRNTGSGSGDMFAYIPVSAFSGVPAGWKYLTLYSQFGTNYSNNDGYEEWATHCDSGDVNYNSELSTRKKAVCGSELPPVPPPPPPVIPEPMSLLLLGSGLAGVVGASRRKKL